LKGSIFEIPNNREGIARLGDKTAMPFETQNLPMFIDEQRHNSPPSADDLNLCALNSQPWFGVARK
jgi:hypothetical protein